MPLTVHLPVRLRIDAEAFASRRAAIDELDEALAAALRRALVNSRAVVVEPRGGYVGLDVHAPEFSWRGDALHRLSANTRRLLETRLRERVLRDAERVLFDDRCFVAAPDPMPVHPSEAIDRDRHWATAGYYAVPSYRRKGRQVLVPTQVTFTPEETQLDDVRDWATISRFDQLLTLVPDLFAERNRQLPQHGLFGFMYRSDRGALRLDILEFDDDRARRVVSIDITLPMPRWDPGQGKVIFVPGRLSPVGTFRLTSHGKTSSDRAEAKRILDKHLREHVLPLFLRSAPVNVEPHLIEARFAEASERLFNQLAKKRNAIHLAELQLPIGREVLLLLEEAVPDGTIEIMPVAEWTVVSRRAPGDGAGAGARRRKSVLDPSILTRLEGEPADILLQGASDGTIFPKFKPLFPSALTWEPFEGEPSVDDLGEDGKLLRGLMERIAQRLEMSEWKPYAGRFVINASIVIGARAHAVQATAVGEPPVGILLASVVVSGNLGRGHFTPQPSKATAFYKFILATASWINLLYDAVKRVFSSRAHDDQLAGLVAGPPHWLRHVHDEYHPSLVESCGWIFIYTCQAMMLQLLGASKRAIQHRLTLRESYADFFYRAVVSQIASAGELVRLRDGLKGAIAKTPRGQKVSAQDVVLSGRAPVQPPSSDLHRAAHSDLDRLLEHGRRIQQAGFFEGDITYRDGQPAILDRRLNAWTIHDLDLAIQVRQSSAMALDPVLNHYLHEHPFAEVSHYSKAEAAAALIELLRTMLAKNEDTSEEAVNDKTYAFEKGKIVEISDIDDRQYIPKNRVAGFDLQGIHLIAWQELAPEVGLDPTLEQAIDALFSRELGFRSIKNFSEFVGITALAIVCPPLAEAVMVAQAVHGVYEAHKLEGFYESFIDPEQLLSWSDVRAEQFAANISLAIALLPNGGRIVRTVFPRAHALLKSALRTGLRAPVIRELTAMLEEIAMFLKKDLATAFLSGLGTNYVMSIAIEQMMAPLAKDVARHAALPPSEQ